MRIFLISITILLGIGGFVVAQNVDLDFPIQELGSCGSELECFEYCSNPAHLEACVTFGVENNLMSAEAGQAALQAGVLDISGPGGCITNEECDAYCNDVAHIEECIAFAEEQGMMSPEELAEAKMIARALREGVPFPGGCRSEAECEAYCEDFSHMQECLDFAERVGFMTHREIQEARQMEKAIKAGLVLPGDCMGEDDCDKYCEDEANIEECFEFAVAAGFIPPEDQENARRMMKLMARGEVPSWCREKDECEVYCSDTSHTEECSAFFVTAGFMTPEQAEMYIRTGGKGPEGCEKEECEAFCNNPENQEVCFQFAKEHGLLSDEELHNIEEGVNKFHEGFSSAPPDVAQCLKERIGEEVLSKLDEGTFIPNPELGEHMRNCFEEFMPKHQPGQEGEFQGSPEELACIESIVGDIRVERTSEQEQIVREQCFGQHQGPPSEEFIPESFPPPEEFTPGEIQEKFEEFIPEIQEHFESPKEPEAPESFDVTGTVLDVFWPILERIIP